MTGNAKALFETHPDAGGFTLDGKDQAVLCLHGFTATPQTFSDLARKIHQATNFHVDVPGLPGHGTFYQDLNAVTSKDWIDFAEDKFLNLKKEFKKVHLVGLSLGGTLCEILNQRHPGSIDSINLLAPGLMMSNRSQFTQLKIVQFLPKCILKHLIKTKESQTPGHVSYKSYSIASVVEVIKTLSYLKKRLGPSHTPTLIQVPKDDLVIDPQSSHMIAEQNPKANVMTIDPSQHIMLLGQNMNIVMDQVIRFIKGNM